MNRPAHALVLGALLGIPCALPAQRYFQQRVDHAIEVALDDRDHMLRGTASFTYVNNSPAVLDTIWLHLWPNAYRDRASALNRQMVSHGNLKLQFSNEEERGWIDSLDFHGGGVPLTWGYHVEHADIGWVKPAQPLRPGASTTISTPFRVKVPDGKFSRLGHTGQAYYITQWYPKPAVFDARGWHPMPYLTQGEFFSEFGRFDVRITLPANYVVGATGMLQDNAAEEAFMDSLAMAAVSRPGKVVLPGVSERLNAFPPSAPATKTLHFVQDDVHDFAWFADKRFQVRKSSVTLPRSGRTVTTWALFTPANAGLWGEGVDYINESVRLYSEWVGDYPYDACTAVDGTISAGGGMEYPMVTVIGTMPSKEALDNVIAHEVGHNWFYGVLGSNEREHPWMDEGVNSFMELRYMRQRYPGGGLSVGGVPGLKNLLAHVTDPNRFQSEAMYRLNARRNLDQPPSLPAEDFTSLNYGAMVYGKSALAFDHLFAYLGEETFDRCMRAYFEEWKFRHPGPADMRRVFERESGEQLGWVFDGLLGTTHKLDPRALRLKNGRLNYRVNAAAPVPVTGWKGDLELGTVWFGPDSVAWRGAARTDRLLPSDGSFQRRRKGTATATLPWPDADRVRIDAGNRTLDIDRRNNAVRASGLFRRWANPEVKLFPGLEREDRRSTYWMPIAAWNEHDGFQMGIGLTNTIFPSQRTEWVVAPLYGLISGRVIGAARIERHFDRLRSRVFENIHVGLSGRSASTRHNSDNEWWYAKLTPSITFDIKRDPLTRPWHHQVRVRGIGLREDRRTLGLDGEWRNEVTDRIYADLSYRARSGSVLLPFEIEPLITWNEDFLRASVEIKQGFTYNKKKDQLRVRAFAGKFLSIADPGLEDRVQTWQLSWGPVDMLYDHVYLERGWKTRQFYKHHGAFRTPFDGGGSDDWIAAFNAELDLPMKLPFSLFGSAGFVPLTTITPDGTSKGTAAFYEAGIGLQVVRDVLEVWFPLVVSQRIADEEAFHGRVLTDRVRYVLTLELLDPTRLLRRVKH